MARDQGRSLKSKTPKRSPDPGKGTSLPDDSCNQDRMQGLEDIGAAMQSQYGRCHDIHDSEDGSLEKSPADFTPDLKASSTRPDQIEHAEEGNGAIDPLRKAQWFPISDIIVRQLDDDKGDGDESGEADNDDDEDYNSRDDNTPDDISTPLTEVTAVSSEIPDIESGT